ncbi:B12-binding domain-containing radical SAM protein [Clostridia bacterium]|nr:B12-binding domain-containing radical SAM protein [Clostridia bacterium]
MLSKLLKNVQKPARYTGGELNSVVKNPADVYIRFAFCFPDLYEVGMSHLGMKILYSLLNSRDDCYCERVFAPALDMEDLMRANDVSLFALETGDCINTFDILGFTMQYEMSYTNVLNMLDLANIPLLAKDRVKDEPFICAGGPSTYNPEPLADFIDFFTIGDGEEVICEVLDVYISWKKSGDERVEFLKQICKIEGVYVPQFYDVEYFDNGKLKNFTPIIREANITINKRVFQDLNLAPFPENIIVPYMETIHDRITLELFRGCTRGCRFCQAGYVGRPVRERSSKTLLDTAEKSINATGYEEISLCSLSTSDYSELQELCDELLKLTETRKIGLAVPSLRLDNFSMELMHKIQKVRKSGLTFAPEAGSQRMRDIINKNITEEDLVNAATTAFAGGYRGAKLYFMLGLPFETDEDILDIGNLAELVANCYYKTPKEIRHKELKIVVSTSTFIPKPHTPFQWAEQITTHETMRRQNILKSALNKRYFSYNWHGAETSLLEGVFSRGDRRLGVVLLSAHKKGCKLDSWSEHFKFDAWMEAFEENGVDPLFYSRKRDLDELLPWAHINIGVKVDFLKREYEKAAQAITTPQCREKCAGCGIENCKILENNL